MGASGLENATAYQAPRAPTPTLPQRGREKYHPKEPQLPRYASCTFGLPSSSRPVPDSTMLPVSIT